MKGELMADLQSRKALLSAINLALLQKNFDLRQTGNWLLSTPGIAFKKSRNRGILILAIALFPMLLVAQSFSVVPTADDEPYARTKYQIDNLRGDVMNTWLHWKIADSSKLIVNIMNSKSASSEQIEAIKEAILSEKSVQIDDSLLHKGPEGVMSTYYLGWMGALKEAAKGPTKFNIPKEFAIIKSQNGEGDIVLVLLNERDADGYSGFTKSVVENNQILKSTITIYNIDELSADRLGTIVRHEFGHALGLAHSSAPEDLMADYITTSYPYISECNVSAVSHLYDGRSFSEVVCEK